MEGSGLLENTWLVVTSDHGEMFERGVRGHGTNTLYQPVIRIPLLIFEPGRTTGLDIHTATSSVDVLPTLAHVTGQPIPDWSEGAILPPFADDDAPDDRAVYAVQAEKIPPGAPLSRVSTALIKGQYKLHYYHGYTDLGVREQVQLYDLESDPEELVDLAASEGEVASSMLEQLKDRLQDADRAYQ